MKNIRWNIRGGVSLFSWGAQKPLPMFFLGGDEILKASKLQYRSKVWNHTVAYVFFGDNSVSFHPITKPFTPMESA